LKKKGFTVKGNPRKVIEDSQFAVKYLSKYEAKIGKVSAIV
jgi:hypothetical protein